MNATTIVAYTFQAEILCRPCMRRKAAFQAEANGMNAEMVPLADLLAAWAKRQGIEDPEDEYTYDSDDFPKVVFASDVEDDETCHGCGEEIL